MAVTLKGAGKTDQPTSQPNHTGLYGTSVSYLFLKFELHTPGHLGHYDNFGLSERALDSESKEGASSPGSATSQAE